MRYWRGSTTSDSTLKELGKNIIIYICKFIGIELWYIVENLHCFAKQIKVG